MTGSVIANLLLAGWLPMIIVGGFIGVLGVAGRAQFLAGLGLLMTVLGVFHLVIVMLCVICSKIFLLN